MTSNFLAGIGIFLTVAGVVITFIAQRMEQSESSDVNELLLKKQNEIQELQARINRQGGEINQTITQVEGKIDGLSTSSEEEAYVAYKKIFKSRFERSIRNHLINYFGYDELVRAYPHSGKRPPELVIIEHYDSFEVVEGLLEAYLENTFVYIHGSGISLEVLDRARLLYTSLRKEVDAHNQEKFLDILIKNQSNANHNREGLLILDNVVQYPRQNSFTNMVIAGVYIFRILEEAMLLAGQITEDEKVGKFIFSSGITFEANMVVKPYDLPKKSAVEEKPKLFGIKP